MLKSRVRTPKLYRALFRISSLRDEIRALASEMTPDDESRYLLRLDRLEATAVRLVDESETRRRVSSH